jgi:hypothetical protein
MRAGTLLDIPAGREVTIMMNTVVGSALGGLVAAAIALVASGQAQRASAPYWETDPNAARAMAVADTRGLNQAATVQCQPSEEAVLRRAFVSGREVAEVTCISRMNDRSSYYSPQPVYADAQPVVRTVQRPAARSAARERVVYTEPREEDRRTSNRSWGKTAMIIGGSSGAGAGVGALVGGKKGALIGAAIGGGAATIYESTKR